MRWSLLTLSMKEKTLTSKMNWLNFLLQRRVSLSLIVRQRTKTTRGGLQVFGVSFICFLQKVKKSLLANERSEEGNILLLEHIILEIWIATWRYVLEKTQGMLASLYLGSCYVLQLQCLNYLFDLLSMLVYEQYCHTCVLMS